MIIRNLEQRDRELYDKCVKEHGTVFNSLAWLSIFNGRANVYGIYEEGGVLIGGFITYCEKKFGLSLYRDPPFTQSIGPFLSVSAQNPTTIMTNWKKALSAMADFFDNLPCSVISCSFNVDVVDMQPFIWRKFKVIPGYTYQLDLTISESDILMRMSNERRKNINRGTKDGLVVQQTKDYDLVKCLVVKTFLRQNERCDVHYLNRILFEFASEKNSFAFVTYNENHPIACTFCLHDEHKAYYLLGGYDSEMKHHGAGTMAMWESIRYAKGLGVSVFDFEGSKIPQIERYFRGFGGRLVPYYQINKAKLFLEILLKLSKREIF